MVTGFRPKNPSVPLTELEQSAFCRTGDLKSLSLEEELKAGVRWQRLPVEYMRMSPDELDRRITENRSKLGKDLVILGHHYQRDEIIKFADVRGDSLKLAQYAAGNSDAGFVIFCGVHFMAETACILSHEHQKIVLPNITAGCSMSDMAPADEAWDAWNDLEDLLGSGEVIPVTYMNSAAAIKDLCGRNGGVVCTSANAAAVLRWAYSQGSRVLFIPDQHLGRNSGLKIGLSLQDMVVWNPYKTMGGNTPEQLFDAKLILWKGHCSVHTRFTSEQVEKARREYPGVTVMVHPECIMEVVQEADSVGSTEHISDTINDAPPGSIFAVGTEISLVRRIADENPDKTVFCLDPIVCPCSTMYRIHPAYLAWVTDGLLAGVVPNEVTVDPGVALNARVALERMLSIV